MAYKFKRLADVEQVNSDNKLVLSEVDGSIKKTTIDIKSVTINYYSEDNINCIGMTYDEAVEILTNRGILQGYIMYVNPNSRCFPIIRMYKPSRAVIVIIYYGHGLNEKTLYWTEDGIYTYDPTAGPV